MRGLCLTSGRRFSQALAGALASTALTLGVGGVADAQEAPADAAPQFAEGVLTTIAPEVDRVDTLSIHDIVELRADEGLKWTPSPWLAWEPATIAPTNRTLYEMAQDAAFVQDVYCLELAFKPLRMIEVDVPRADGRVERAQVWYLVYRVRNTGAGLDGEMQADGSYETAALADQVGPLRFVPQFVLSSQEREGEGAAAPKAYLDRLVPAAMAAIERREMPSGALLNSVEMAGRELPVESGRSQRGAWGVAMWQGVDPEIDFFSVYVGGLTNAYRWDDPEGAFQAGDRFGKGRKFVRKTLQLNFWRPGDALNPNEREVRFGAAPGEGALYNAGEGVAYQWVYR
ncbi:MAG TPA: hypothetical protein VEQ85_04385 [Lacipirellulaceae bacterium]|nr:hypothetical protein [Lacipirellulaceae bacterium]